MLSIFSKLFGFSYMPDSGEKENIAISLLARLFQMGIILLFIFSLGVQLYNFDELKWSTILPNCLWQFSLMTLIAGSSFVLGGLSGFLFGIPMRSKNSTENQSAYSDNDNLVQVSDWLTKIIVGVGLTQIGEIPEKLSSLGATLAPAFYQENIGSVAAIATVVYFSITGFTITYLWTRIYFKKMLVTADNEIVKMLPSYLSVGIQPTDFKSKDYHAPSYPNKKMTASQPAPPDDPQKYQWGGKSENNGRKLSAIVTPVNWSKEYFNIELKVVSTDSQKPLNKKVTFHLHPSFRNADPVVEIANGQAVLNALAYGAFTVGAETDDGDTVLELDLSELSNAPTIFKSR
ncbi:hypothetical protein WSM22_04600 [Cytophagales bacterium WSM2-2]|nr:hypothetical protein WSM22_04600 [Cytophagales bacterium WSM2-2]